jgi:hypothetical protein
MITLSVVPQAIGETVGAVRLTPRVPLSLPVSRHLYRFHLRRLVTDTKVTARRVAIQFRIDSADAGRLLRGWPLMSMEQLHTFCAELDREDWIPLLSHHLVASWHKTVKPPMPVGPLGVGLVTGLEAYADGIVVYDPYAVPPHLRTQMYAAALTRQDTLTHNVTREQRAAPVLNELDPLPFMWITSEEAIRARVGSPAVMDDQLRYLAAVATRPHVTVRVIPTRTPGTPSLPFQLIHGTPPVAVTTDSKAGMRVDPNVDTVDSHLRLVDRAQRLALSRAESLRLIREVSA